MSEPDEPGGEGAIVIDLDGQLYFVRANEFHIGRDRRRRRLGREHAHADPGELRGRRADECQVPRGRGALVILSVRCRRRLGIGLAR
jgi:hypothetical protein